MGDAEDSTWDWTFCTQSWCSVTEPYLRSLKLRTSRVSQWPDRPNKSLTTHLWACWSQGRATVQTEELGKRKLPSTTELSYHVIAQNTTLFSTCTTNISLGIVQPTATSPIFTSVLFYTLKNLRTLLYTGGFKGEEAVLHFQTMFAQ